jgi:hypothetical protein
MRLEDLDIWGEFWSYVSSSELVTGAVNPDDYAEYQQSHLIAELILAMVELNYLRDCLESLNLRFYTVLTALCLQYAGDYLGNTGISLYPKLQLSMLQLTLVIPMQ